MQDDLDSNRKGKRTPERVNGKRISWIDFHVQNRFLQIYSKGLEYTILSDKFEPCHPFVLCKDFIHDVVHASLNDRSFEIYRFKYNPTTNPKPCLKEIRIAVANSRDTRFAKKIASSLDFLNQIESKLGIPHSKVRKCINPLKEYDKSGIYIFQGNKRWIMSPPMLSLYLLLIRVGFSHFKGHDYYLTINGLKENLIKPYQSKDCRWIAQIEPALHKIIRIGDKKIFYRDIKLNYPSLLHIDVIHNRMGIIGFANDMIAKNAGQPVIMPYWHLLK